MVEAVFILFSMTGDEGTEVTGLLIPLAFAGACLGSGFAKSEVFRRSLVTSLTHFLIES